ncbi:hypothetical protein [Caulobacter sp. UNC279MFTsu5.1]|uniref:DUF3617 domain-containing protein n=1 Tax=Caulobacter sp. UNC279MFTsu5.1 TaxID=1502775 RepID=UPI00036F298A|nr:hypothetical protein [Caulobacter sp. UNC279MFTsu5.1]SFI74821.1 hypothetical protein SAMN02799626_00502 [Caulobacter sp. UNC279MFTsu5.1]
MSHPVSSARLLVPILLGPVLLGLAACSRTDDRAREPATASSPAASAPQDAAPAAGGPTTLKPGLWKTVTQTPAGPEDSTQCVGEGFDPGAEAARKVSPCGNPTVTRTADGFRLEHACQKDHIDYRLTGRVSGDFITTADTDLELVVSAFGRKQTLRMKASSTYQGPCEPGAPIAGKTAGKPPVS